MVKTDSKGYFFGGDRLSNFPGKDKKGERAYIFTDGEEPLFLFSSVPVGASSLRVLVDVFV